jgi:3-oxoadipate enol-lactonase
MPTGKNNSSIQTNSITTYYDDLGEGNIPVLFIHGFPFNRSSWKPQIDFFKNYYRVIAYDIRGFGQSTSNDVAVSIPLFVDDLIALMDTLSIKKAIVAGISMGGYILLNALNRYPERIEAAILIDTQCVADTPEAKEKRYANMEKIKSEGLTDFADGFVKNVFYEETLNYNKKLVEEIKASILATPPQAIIKTLSALAERQETCSVLHKISIPTLIMCGKYDKAVPVEQSEFLHTNITNATFHRIDNAAHLPNLEQPQAVNKHIHDFLLALNNKAL